MINNIDLINVLTGPVSVFPNAYATQKVCIYNLDLEDVVAAAQDQGKMDELLAIINRVSMQEKTK